MNDSYLAGFFDGEGCVMSYKASRSGIRQPQIYLSQKNDEVLKAIQTHLGYGRLSPRRGSIVARLYIRGNNNILDFGERVGYESIVKYPQLMVVMAMARLPRGSREERSKMANEIKRLNHADG